MMHYLVTVIPAGLALAAACLAWRRRARIAPALAFGILSLLFLGASTGGMPIVTTNSQLMALPSYQWFSVLRMGVNTLGDAPPKWFNPSATACAISGGDIGSQNPSTDGGCFNAAPTSGLADVRQWGVSTTGATDVTPQLTAAAATGVSLFFPPGKYQFGSLTLTGGNQRLEGSGFGWDASGMTTTFQQNTPGDFITLNGNRNTISNVLFEPIVRTNGYQIVVGQNCYSCFIEKFHMSYAYNGINVVGSNTTIGSAAPTLMGPMQGLVGIRFAGPGAAPSQPQQNILTINNVLINNAYLAPTNGGNVTAWATSKAFPVNAVINVNGSIYQTLSACTSAASGSGPSGWPAGTTPVSIWSDTVPDGTCGWRFISNDMIGFVNDSWGMSATLNDFTVLNNLQCVKVQDTNPSINSEPAFVHFLRLSCDHNFTNAADVEAGVDIEFWNIYASSNYQGNGVLFGGTFLGGGKVIGGIASANSKDGVFIAAGKNTVVSGITAMGNSQAGAGLHNNIEAAANVSSFVITNNMVDGKNLQEGSPIVMALSGVLVDTGTSDYYVITGNICNGTGETTGGQCAVDGGTGTHKTVSGNW